RTSSTRWPAGEHQWTTARRPRVTTAGTITAIPAQRVAGDPVTWRETDTSARPTRVSATRWSSRDRRPPADAPTRSDLDRLPELGAGVEHPHQQPADGIGPRRHRGAHPAVGADEHRARCREGAIGDRHGVLRV